MEYGSVRYGRTESDGDYGNVRAERIVPVIVPDGATPAEVLAAEHAAWERAVEQVHEEINKAFEADGLSAPFWDGPTFSLVRWRQDQALLLIVPDNARVPGGAARLAGVYGHRLEAVHRIADQQVKKACYRDVWDFADGDFEELEALQTALEQEMQAEANSGEVFDDDEDGEQEVAF